MKRYGRILYHSMARNPKQVRAFSPAGCADELRVRHLFWHLYWVTT